MQLTCLSDVPNKPCYVLELNGVTLMLDCALDMSPSLNFMPLPLVQSSKLAQNCLPKRDVVAEALEGELRESSVQGRAYVDSSPEFAPPDRGLVDPSSIDAILVSNYTTMLGLPYVTEDPGFRGQVFMTEPCLNFGRLFMEETIEYIERSAVAKKKKGASAWKDFLPSLPPPLSGARNPHGWRRIYTRSAMESSLSKVTMVGFSERKDVFGLVTVSPASSGYCIGSSNWIVSSGFERVAYVSGSSTLTTHPRPMDQAPLRNADCLVLTGLTQAPTHNPDPMIGEFCKTVLETTRAGGNVLVPCYPSGIVYDLLECLAGQMDLHGGSATPMYFVSPVADSSLAYANIMAEWLTSVKQQRVYAPEEPFPHGQLAKTGRLKSFRALHDEAFSEEYRQPCVVFCGHPSLRFGDVTHFLELWGANHANAVVFTEPSFAYLEALAPFQPLLMKTVHCPIDTSLNFSQAKKLIRDLRPGMIAVPEAYTVPPESAPLRTDLVIDEVDAPRHTFSRYETIELPVKSRMERIYIDPELAAKMRPVEVRPGVQVATVTGNLSVVNNRYSLEDPDKDGDKPQPSSSSSSRKKRKRGGGGGSPPQPPSAKASLHRPPDSHLFGKMDVRQLVCRLSGVGIVDARVEEASPGILVVHLDGDGISVTVDRAGRRTHVESTAGRKRPDSEAVRAKIRDVVVSCLEKY